MDDLIEKIEHFSKSKNALRTIGEVADLISVEQHVIRFWESKFPQLKPYKNRGIRYFTMQDIELLSRIKSYLYDEGYTIKGVQQLLMTKGKKFSETNQKDVSGNILVSKEVLMKICDQLVSLRNKLTMIKTKYGLDT